MGFTRVSRRADLRSALRAICPASAREHAAFEYALREERAQHAHCDNCRVAYRTGFTRVLQGADPDRPLQCPDRYGSPDGNPAHIHVSPGKTWHTIRRGRPRSTRRVNPENHAGVYRSQPAPRCVSSGFKLGGGYALLVKESCTPHILTREARQRGDEPPAVVMRTRRVPSAVR